MTSMDETDESISQPAGVSGSRIAFFGGSFDPPHLGHLAVARAARAALGLDTVLFAPVGAQPLKAHGSTASFEDRVAMTRLAIAGEEGFAVSLADAPKASGAPNYTLETLEELKAGLAANCILFCLMGADSFVGLRQWHRAAEIPFVAPLIVASRPGERLDNLKALLPEGLTMEFGPGVSEIRSEVEVRCYFLLNEAGERAPFYLLPGLDVEISASEIRAQVRAAQGSQTAGHELLPDAVSDYLRTRGLYR
jgi:nicotinate-nucleotide adenylyltransferase